MHPQAWLRSWKGLSGWSSDFIEPHGDQETAHIQQPLKASMHHTCLCSAYSPCRRSRMNSLWPAPAQTLRVWDKGQGKELSLLTYPVTPFWIITYYTGLKTNHLLGRMVQPFQSAWQSTWTCSRWDALLQPCICNRPDTKALGKPLRAH